MRKLIMKRKKILFVCTGNTCRSPMAEALLRNKIKRNKIKWWDVASCGIQAEVGGKMSTNSKAVLEELGINTDKFMPRQLTQALIEKSTLVVCMTKSQQTMLEACGNITCVMDICGFDVPDPYGCSIDVYRLTREALDKACDKIIENYIKTFKEE